MAFLLVTVFALVLAEASGAETKPFNVRDLVAMDRVADPRVSPDGRWIVFTVSRLDLEANKRRTHLWLVAQDGTRLRQLTAHEASDSSPRWSPDSHWIWFLSARSGSQQVWRIPIDGGEAQPVTRLPLDVGSFRLSRDGSKLAFSLEVFVGNQSLENTKKQLDKIKDRKASGQIFDRLLFRHWDTWSDGRRSHLFVMPATGGESRDLMKDMDADAPSKPYGDDQEYTFTPDGTGLLFTAKYSGHTEAWSTDFDLWLAPVDGSVPPRKLTDNPACDTTPCFSPDGTRLAYLAMKRPGYESDRWRIMVRQWPSGPDRCLTESWDRSPSSLVWSADGKELYVTAENLGQQSLFAVAIEPGPVRTIVESGAIRSPAVAGNSIIFTRDTLTFPADLCSVATQGSAIKKLTEFNQDRLAMLRMGQPEQFTFNGWNQEPVYGYLVRPVDFEPQKKYPVAFLIHGGPQGSFANHFHYRWNAQTYTGAGYAVVMIDFHGSTGYGQAFTDSIRDDWGGKPLEDLKLGLAEALQRYSFLDGQRVAALGASYGAYMVNWIAGVWPDRFRCLVSHDGNLDERAAYFMTEELWFPEWEHLGTPWDNPESYEKHNPLNQVRHWQTPILVVHGGRDFRIPDSQGLATFTAAQRRGVPSKFLYFPDENHWVLKPHNSILWHDTIMAWLDQWTK